MLTKDVEVGRGGYRITKKVIDWDAVWGWVIMGGIALFLLSMCSG